MTEEVHSINLDPRRHELLEARLYGTGPLAAKTAPTPINCNSGSAVICAPGSVLSSAHVNNMNNNNNNNAHVVQTPVSQNSSDYHSDGNMSIGLLHHPPPGASQDPSVSNQNSLAHRCMTPTNSQPDLGNSLSLSLRLPPSALGQNEGSNISSAGSTSGQDPETPDKSLPGSSTAVAQQQQQLHNGQAANALSQPGTSAQHLNSPKPTAAERKPRTGTAEKKRKRRRNTTDEDNNNSQPGSQQHRTPKDGKISRYLVKSSPQPSQPTQQQQHVGTPWANAPGPQPPHYHVLAQSQPQHQLQPTCLQFTPIQPAPLSGAAPSGSGQPSAVQAGQPTPAQQQPPAAALFVPSRTTPPNLGCCLPAVVASAVVNPIGSVGYTTSADGSPTTAGAAGAANDVQTQTDDGDGGHNELQRKDGQIDEMTRVTEELRAQLISAQRRIEEQNARLDKCKEMTKKLLIEQSKMERQQRKAKSMEKCLELGQFRPERRGHHFEEIWTEGYAFEQINKKLKQINQERNDIAQACAQLRKRKPTSSERALRDSKRAQAAAAAGVVQLQCSPASSAVPSTSQPQQAAQTDDGVFARPDPPSQLSSQEYYEQDEIYRLRRDQLKKEEVELQAELDRLDRERNVHIRELKRLQNEEASTYKEHVILNKRYLLLSLLGKGGFSEVWHAFDLEDQRYVACKIHHVIKEWKEDKKANYVKHALREKDIHKTLEHPRVVRLFDLFTIDNHSFCTVLEYCDGNDLDFYLKQNKTIPEKEARSIIMQLVSALKYLNDIKPPIIHYDLKPANILLSSGTAAGEIKITDFGLSKVMEDEKYDPEHGMDLTSQFAGTYWYLPPECFLVGQAPPKINSKVDVWSVGVIFYQCLYGKRPFGHEQTQARILEENTILNATEVNFPNKPAVSQDAKAFMHRCLQYKKEERADVQELYLHKYLRPRGKTQSTSEAGPSSSGPAASASTTNQNSSSS